MHQLPFGASISDTVLAELKRAAVHGRDQTPEMLPEIRLVEVCGDAMAGLRPTSEGRLSFRTEPVNRLAAYSARPAATKWEWAILLFERKYAHSVFVIGEFEFEIGEEAQTALKGKVLDLVDNKIIAILST
ncbi:MAG: hypothetical protein HY298_15450 [Verrucomicrobia bacterium]|nr:hypothetical protein [Verrucomicrobiota bacterium]